MIFALSLLTFLGLQIAPQILFQVHLAFFTHDQKGVVFVLVVAFFSRDLFFNTLSTAEVFWALLPPAPVDRILQLLRALATLFLCLYFGYFLPFCDLNIFWLELKLTLFGNLFELIVPQPQ